MRLQENEVDNIERIQLYTREFNKLKEKSYRPVCNSRCSKP